jgi:putative PIN family toxin of toxin-antitoxin system
MRVVLDANVFVSALISSRGAPAQVVDAWLTGRFDVVISAAILTELQRVLAYDRLRKYARIREASAEFVELISSQALWVEPAATISVIEDDPSDNRYLECAVGGNAEYVVSGDGHLLDVGEHRGIRILSPTAFVVLLVGDQL